MSGNGDILSIKITLFHFLRPRSGTEKDYLKQLVRPMISIASTFTSHFPLSLS
jgi:hypothetical protein